MKPAASVVIASLNEGANLWRTVQSCLDTRGDLSFEILIADDHSDDGSVDEVRRRFPDVRIVTHAERRGVSVTKDHGAREARGDVLIFLDGHCKPELNALAALVDDVDDLDGRAVVTPAVCGLDADAWENRHAQVGHGYGLVLADLSCRWLPTGSLRRHGKFLESPALIGCCVAMSRTLYRELRGFDCGMQEWGVEDLDLGLKAWLLGSLVLNDPTALIGHRFRQAFDTYRVSAVHPIVNQLRMARKNFEEAVWLDWLAGCQRRHAAWPAMWADVCDAFAQGRETLERERDYLQGHRVRDEFMFADAFGLDWPSRAIHSSPHRHLHSLIV